MHARMHKLLHNTNDSIVLLCFFSSTLHSLFQSIRTVARCNGKYHLILIGCRYILCLVFIYFSEKVSNIHNTVNLLLSALDVCVFSKKRKEKKSVWVQQYTADNVVLESNAPSNCIWMKSNNEKQNNKKMGMPP